MESDTNTNKKASIVEAAKQEAADALVLGGDVVRKASTLSISIAVVLAVLFAGFIALIYFSKDTIIKVVETSGDVKRLQSEHDHCHAELADMKEEVRQLRGKIERLEARVASN